MKPKNRKEKQMSITIASRFDIPQDIRDSVIAPGYTDLEVGYRDMGDGLLYACTYARFPYAKGDMVKWWFGTWLHDTASYRLWSKDHVSFYWDDRKRPGTPEGSTHISSEYLGETLVEMEISFFDPAEIFDVSKFAENNISLILVAEINSPAGDFISTFLHVVRDTYYGCEMRNRFWLPYGSEQEARDLIAHNQDEMGSLSEFLPNLYYRENQ